MPTTAFVVVITTIGAMLEFTTVYTMTVQQGVTGGDRGGPNFATHVMSYHIFKTAITNQYEGLGAPTPRSSSSSWCVIGYLQYRFLRVRHEY